MSGRVCATDFTILQGPGSGRERGPSASIIPPFLARCHWSQAACALLPVSCRPGQQAGSARSHWSLWSGLQQRLPSHGPTFVCEVRITVADLCVLKTAAIFPKGIIQRDFAVAACFCPLLSLACSGDYIIMFDPHARHLPGINPAQPGLRIGFTRASGAALVRQFPAAFAPFTKQRGLFEAGLTGHYPGVYEGCHTRIGLGVIRMYLLYADVQLHVTALA